MKIKKINNEIIKNEIDNEDNSKIKIDEKMNENLSNSKNESFIKII